ncbi:MAG: serine hydrolase domain-containing protein [Acidimicrobiales bacterium]
MDGLGTAIDRIAAETGFSGVVRVHVDGAVALARAYGLASRACGRAHTVDGRLGIASGGKGLTALTVVSLIQDGVLELAQTARSVLGPDLPLIGDDVTVEHLLAHRSGIGDYLDEDDAGDIDDYALSTPVHELTGPEQYLPMLGGHPAKFAAGERFSYCNGGYVVLALIAERATGTPFAELVGQRVITPAGMADTAFLRSDELGGDAAVGYVSLDGLRTNVFHLPVVGGGDGGVYSTAADIDTLWSALLAGRIVSPHWVATMVRPRSEVPSEAMRYGLGFWLHQSGEAVMLVGFDAGVSFRTVHHPTRGVTHTVLSNTSRGAWPVTRALDELLAI